MAIFMIILLLSLWLLCQVLHFRLLGADLNHKVEEENAFSSRPCVMRSVRCQERPAWGLEERPTPGKRRAPLPRMRGSACPVFKTKSSSHLLYSSC